MNRWEMLFRPWRDLGHGDECLGYPPINRWAITCRPWRDFRRGGLKVSNTEITRRSLGDHERLDAVVAGDAG